MHWTVRYVFAVAADRDISVRELERESGVGVNTISRWKEEGRMPNINSLEKVLASLGYRLKIEKI